MSQPWSYYATPAANPYQYYQQYGYGYEPYGTAPAPAPPDGTDGTTPNPPPPGLPEGSDRSTEAFSSLQVPYVAPAGYACPQYSGSTYGQETGMDAAQRWNAMNCSYMGYGVPTAPTTPSAPVTPYNATSGPRFPTKNYQHTANGTPYSVYPGPRPQNVYSTDSSSKLSLAAGGEKEWSPELKEYVKRAFCSTESATEKDQMEKILKEKIEYVFRNKITIDWTKEPIPFIPSKSVVQAATSATSINIVRPMPMPTRRPRGRVGGHLPTGTLDRNHVNAHSFPSKSACQLVSRVAPITKTNGLQSSETVNTQSKRSRFSTRSRSRSSSPSSRSPTSTSSSRASDNHRQRHLRQRGNRQRTPSHPPSASRKQTNLRNRRPRFSAGDSERSNDSDSNSRQGGSPPRSGRNQNRKSGCNRQRLPSTGSSSPSPNIPVSNKSRGGRRGRGNGGRGRGGKKGTRWAPPDNAQHRLIQRADRFKDHLGAGSIAKSASQLSMMTGGEDSDLVAEQLEQFSIVGTMKALEKPYLRLTSAPEPSNVRPASVLMKSLTHVQKRWRERGDYLWVCEQFKSIRQDLNVQRIQTEFTAEVYEAHADIALEAGDSQEFHQCQSQLSILHAEGLGKTRFNEFTAYRLLYYIFTQDHLSISTLLASLTPSQHRDVFIRFALTLREAWALRNYKRFFRLACSSRRPVEGKDDDKDLRGCQQVLAWSLDRERKQALKAIFKACVLSFGEYISHRI